MFRKIKQKIRQFLYIYVGINSFLAILVTIGLLYHFFIKDFIGLIFHAFSENYDSGSLLHAIASGVFASVIGALLFGAIGLFIFGWYKNIILTGKYDAYVKNDDDGYDAWGEVLISYHPLSTNAPHVPVKLRFKYDDIELAGEGMIINNKFLIAYYYEVSNLARSRYGSITYELNAEGNTWTGIYNSVYPDSDSTSLEPKINEAKWVKQKS